MRRPLFRSPGFITHALLLIFCLGVPAIAGMPSPLPTNWTKDNTPSWASSEPGYDGSADARWQAISFFIVGLLVCAWGVQWLWQLLRHDFTWLPPLNYGRAVSFVVLWGLLFVLVLTMISGARELMTPGAWKQKGWTYKLAQADDAVVSPESGRQKRRQALEELRTSLWHYAATHDGKFPTKDELSAVGWDVPGWPGLTFLYVEGQHAEDQGRLLAFEPELEGDERQVLLTNGMVGTMRTSEIQLALAKVEVP